MLNRVDHGILTRRVLDPVAHELGLDYDDTFYKPPESDAEVAMAALRCGEGLLHSFTYADEWPSDGFMDGLSKRDARKAARYMTRILPTDSGRDAISVMAQQFGLAMAATWRDAANATEDDEDADRLRSQATLSEGLAGLVNTVWPIEGYETVLTAVGESKPIAYDVDNPDALMDLRLYFRRMTGYAAALGVAMCERFDDFERAILTPIWAFSVPYAMATTASWTYELKFWANLLREPSLSHSAMIEQVSAEVS
jgi:hypothetical protein